MEILSKYSLGKFFVFVAIWLFVVSGVASGKADSIEISARKPISCCSNSW